MMKLRSGNEEILEFLENHNYDHVTLDIETLDSLDSLSNLIREPIVSFSISFIPDTPSIVVDFPTFGYVIENKNEELDLLKSIEKIFDSLSKNITIVGHNVANELICKKECRFQNTHGFDIPKILARSSYFNLDLEFLKEFKTYDTMDIAYRFFKHSEHGKLNKAGYRKKFLSSVELESFFNIKRPSNIPKLGNMVRRYFNEKRFYEILLYNCSDTIIESIFYNIFEHKLNTCKSDDGLISFKQNCEHIPTIVEIDKLETWKSLNF